MTSVRHNERPAGAAPPSLIVLNNDAIICEDCYEPQVLELDPGLIPWGRIPIGACSRCGTEMAVPPPDAQPTGDRGPARDARHDATS